MDQNLNQIRQQISSIQEVVRTLSQSETNTAKQLNQISTLCSQVDQQLNSWSGTTGSTWAGTTGTTGSAGFTGSTGTTASAGSTGTAGSAGYSNPSSSSGGKNAF